MRVRNVCLLLVLSTLALACSRELRTASACTVDDQCGYTGRCVESTCIEDARPVARITPPSALSAFDLLTFDGSASADPDAGDAITTHAWTFTAIDAPCAPPVVAGTTAVARVRFACAGRYHVALVVRDLRGVESEPAGLDVAVASRPEALTSAGADLALAHVCADGKCRAVGDVALSASVLATPLGAVRYAWSVEPPPDRPLAPDRRVTFTPSAYVAAPTVAIETDGTAISGDWIFRVEIRDDAGVLGTGVTRVSVLNTPPVITFVDPGPVPHTFDAAGSRFTAAGAVTSVAISDPDGDPLPARTVGWVHQGDGDAVFDGEDRGTEVTFRIVVPYGAPADAAHLIAPPPVDPTAGAGLERGIRLAATDVNGAETIALVPILVANRAPVLATAAKPYVYTNHSYDAPQAQYRASATLGRWVDPDGDPLSQAAPTGDADCASLTFLADGTAVLSCSRAFTGTPEADRFAGQREILESVRDPWDTTATESRVAFEVLNRAPVVTTTTDATGAICLDSPDECCHYSGSICVLALKSAGPVTFGFTPGVTDPDGDPVEVRYPLGVTPAVSVCIGTCPAASAIYPGNGFCGTPPPTTITYEASDGRGAGVTGSHVESVSCR